MQFINIRAFLENVCLFFDVIFVNFSQCMTYFFIFITQIPANTKNLKLFTVK